MNDFTMGLLIAGGMGVFIGAISGWFVGMWMGVRLPTPKPRGTSPEVVPCIGQIWNLEGLGAVQISNLVDPGYGRVVHYTWGGNLMDECKGWAELPDFLRSATLCRVTPVPESP